MNKLMEDVIDAAGLAESKKKYEKELNKAIGKYPRKLIWAAALPVLVTALIVLIAAILIFVLGHNIAAGVLAVMMSAGIVVFSGVILAVHGVLRTIGNSASRLVKTAFEFILEIIEKSHPVEKVELDEIIDETLNCIILPKTSEIIRGTFRYFGYKAGEMVQKYVEVVLKEGIEYIKASVPNKEIGGYAAVKADRYQETIVLFLQNELNDLQYSGGKYFSQKVKELIFGKITAWRNSDTAKEKIGKAAELINDLEKKNNKIKEIEKVFFMKTKRTYGKVVFFVGAAGGLVLVWGALQMTLLCFAIIG